MTASKRGKPITLHLYNIRLTVGANTELSDRRLSALASRLQMLLNNLGYMLVVEDGEQPLHVLDHATEVMEP